jgi:hypothetical protein
VFKRVIGDFWRGRSDFFFFFLINNVMSLKKRRRAQHKKYIKVQPKRPLSEQEVYKSTHKSRKQKCMN